MQRTFILEPKFMLFLHCVDLCLLLLHDFWQLDFVLQFSNVLFVFNLCRLFARWPSEVVCFGLWCVHSEVVLSICLERSWLSGACLPDLLSHSQVLTHTWRCHLIMLVHFHLWLDLIRSSNYHCITGADLDLCGLVENGIVLSVISASFLFILHLRQPFWRCLLLNRLVI